MKFSPSGAILGLAASLVVLSAGLAAPGILNNASQMVNRYASGDSGAVPATGCVRNHGAGGARMRYGEPLGQFGIFA